MSRIDGACCLACHVCVLSTYISHSLVMLHSELHGNLRLDFLVGGQYECRSGPRRRPISVLLIDFGPQYSTQLSRTPGFCVYMHTCHRCMWLVVVSLYMGYSIVTSCWLRTAGSALSKGLMQLEIQQKRGAWVTWAVLNSRHPKP